MASQHRDEAVPSEDSSECVRPLLSKKQQVDPSRTQPVPGLGSAFLVIILQSDEPNAGGPTSSSLLMSPLPLQPLPVVPSAFRPQRSEEKPSCSYKSPRPGKSSEVTHGGNEPPGDRPKLEVVTVHEFPVEQRCAAHSSASDDPWTRFRGELSWLHSEF
ncbi:unnamed protein product [Pleuronectes platessa]|uniref:Uncharacterized protein n=1 Tax=Pleuronectes platessa TaxID=8262 RepID=A0A9N7Z6N1_PLEPL|nr:unnamed protein product [Pleuronectes platessa]